jgi:hypothetical protein
MRPPVPLTPSGQAADQASSSNRAGAGNHERTGRTKAHKQSFRESHRGHHPRPNTLRLRWRSHSHSAGCAPPAWVRWRRRRRVDAGCSSQAEVAAGRGFEGLEGSDVAVERPRGLVSGFCGKLAAAHGGGKAEQDQGGVAGPEQGMAVDRGEDLVRSGDGEWPRLAGGGRAVGRVVVRRGRGGRWVFHRVGQAGGPSA